MRNSPFAACIAVALSITMAACGGGSSAPLPAGTAQQQVVEEPGPVDGEGPKPATLSWLQPAGLAPDSWHWTATNPSGSVMVATSIPGRVFISHDTGTTWVPQAGLPEGVRWTSASLSDDGQVIVAVALNGGMYHTLDGGLHWSRIDSTFNAAEFMDYESVSVSADGTRIVAAVMGSGIWFSHDGRAALPTFTQATRDDGGALASWWRAVASDASGMRVVAASHNNDLWVSDDGGATFAPLATSIAGTPIEDAWYRIALSRDGNTLALAGNEEYGYGRPVGSRSTGLYVGRFAGSWSFERASAVAGNYTRITIAASAPVIAATLSGPTGHALISSDNGATFSALATPSTDSVWRSIALVGDASRAVLAAGTFFSTRGHLYVSSGPLAP